MNGIYCQFLFYADKVKLLGKIKDIIEEKKLHYTFQGSAYK